MVENEGLDLNSPHAQCRTAVRDAAQKGGLCHECRIKGLLCVALRRVGFSLPSSS